MQSIRNLGRGLEVKLSFTQSKTHWKQPDSQKRKVEGRNPGLGVGEDWDRIKDWNEKEEVNIEGDASVS